MTAALPGESGGLLAQLKAETALAHRRAEQALNLNLLNAELTLGQYSAILAWLHPRHRALEPAVQDALHTALPPETWQALAWDTRAKLPLLDRDLANLGRAPDIALAAPRWIGSEAEAWGTAYVLEGATLGGQVVTRQLRRVGLPEHYLHYYGGYGPQVGARWRSFGTLLTERHRSSAAPDEFAARAVRAATLTFDFLTYPAGDGRTEPA